MTLPHLANLAPLDERTRVGVRGSNDEHADLLAAVERPVAEHLGGRRAQSRSAS
jgi:hypothetical protein